MTEVNFIEGDISVISADALITAINSDEMWYGGIDNVIKRCADNLFHDQASQQMPLSDGQTVVAHNNGQKYAGAFQNVVFVVDDLKIKLRSVVYKGLKAASDAGFKNVTLPAIRMGVMLGVVEKSPVEAAREICMGIKNFLNENPESLESITFVIYSSPDSVQLLERSYLIE